MIMESPRSPRQERPLAEQHEQWMAHLRRNVVSRRTIVRGAVGAAAGGLLLGAGNWSEQAVAAALASTGTIAGGFVVNGRHLSFGDDPSTQMWAGGQLFNLHKYNAVPPKSVKVWLQYGRDRSYGHTVEAEIRELLTHVPVWDGKPGVLKASRTLNADQFFVHAHMDRLAPGTEYHYRFRYASGREVGVTPDATFITAPGEAREPFTFTAFGDEGIPGPSLDRDPSLLPESDWGEWNNGSFDPGDPDAPSRTKVNTTNAVIREITKVRNLTNGTPSRFNLQAGDLCYAQAQGDIQPIINPDGPNGSQPSSKNTPTPAANSGGWDYYDPWVWTSWLPMIEASAASIPWMFATGNHDTELFSSHVAADKVTVDNYEAHGYGGLKKRMDLPTTGPSACPSVYSFSYGNVGIISLDANELSWEIQGLLGYSKGAQVRWLEDTAGGLAARPQDRLHRRVLPRVRVLDLQRPQLRRRRPVRPRAAVLQVPGRPGGAGPQPRLRADQPADLRREDQQRPVKQAGGRHLAERARRGRAGQGRHHLRHRGHRGHAPLRLDRRRTRPTATSRRARAAARRSYGDAKTQVGPYVNERDFSTTFETVDWSQARYADYGFIALDVTPAPHGRRTTMTLRFINEQGRELDRVVFSRTAGDVLR